MVAGGPDADRGALSIRFVFKMTKIIIFQMMNFVLKMMHFVFKMMNFVLKLMYFVSQHGSWSCGLCIVLHI